MQCLKTALELCSNYTIGYQLMVSNKTQFDLLHPMSKACKRTKQILLEFPMHVK